MFRLLVFVLPDVDCFTLMWLALIQYDSVIFLLVAAVADVCCGVIAGYCWRGCLSFDVAWLLQLLLVYTIVASV